MDQTYNHEDLITVACLTQDIESTLGTFDHYLIIREMFEWYDFLAEAGYKVSKAIEKHGVDSFDGEPLYDMSEFVSAAIVERIFEICAEDDLEREHNHLHKIDLDKIIVEALKEHLADDEDA